MSLASQPIPPGPEETARVARAAFPKGNVYLTMREELGTIYTHETFADLYPKVGQPAVAPWQLALVTVFQFLEGLSDRQATGAVRSRIDWKYALGLSLEDAGFDASVLCEFRARLVAHEAGERLLDEFLRQCQSHGWLKAGGNQRTDSTHVLAAVRLLNRLELVGETLRAALEDLATVAPDWLGSWVPADWVERYGRRIEESRLPRAEAARKQWAEQIGADGSHLLVRVYGEQAPPGCGNCPPCKNCAAPGCISFTRSRASCACAPKRSCRRARCGMIRPMTRRRATAPSVNAVGRATKCI